VISRASSFQLKGTAKGLREVGELLGVRYVLTGSARKAGQALRITAQLNDTATDAQIWAEKYSGTMDDVFDVQERVSRAIVTALQVTLSAAENDRLAERPIKTRGPSSCTCGPRCSCGATARRSSRWGRCWIGRSRSRGRRRRCGPCGPTRK